MKPKKVKFVITDIDGVIVDRMPVYQRAYTMILREYGVPAKFTEEFYYATAGTPILEQFKLALEKYGKKYSDEHLEKIVVKFFEISGQSKSELFPGVKRILTEIREKGIILFATSGSNTAELKSIFREHDLPYDYCLGSDYVPKGDRHISMMADYYNYSLSDFCRQAIYLGDGPVDMKIAKRNNIFAIGITNTVSAEKLLDAGADATIRKLEEILEYI